MPCPNTCGKDKIPRDEVDIHRKECPLEVVYCEYYDIGCKTMLTREKMPAHYGDKMARHLQCMHCAFRRLLKGKENLDNAEVVAKANLLENTEQIKKLLNKSTQQEETIAKLREDVAVIIENHAKIKSIVCSVMIILISVLVLAFAVSISHYNVKFTLITDQLHNLSVTDETNQLHNDEHINLLHDKVQLQNDQFKRVIKAITESSEHIETLTHYLISVLHHAISGLKPSAIPSEIQYILSEFSKSVLLVRPVFKLSNYQEKIKKKENWTSSPFFAFDGGYQMCLKVYPCGIREDVGNHISVELHLMKGPHDDRLQQLDYWPLRGNFSIHLLDQQRKGSTLEVSHLAYEILISDKNIYRVSHDGMVKKIDDLNISQFVSHKELNEPFYFSKYVNSSINGNLYWRVQYNEEDQAPYKDISTLAEQLKNSTVICKLCSEILNFKPLQRGK